MDILFPPLKVLREAIRAVPAVRYALGISGLLAVIALAFASRIGPQVAVLGTLVMMVLMTMLVIFARLTTLAKKKIAFPALIFTWFVLIQVIATATVLFSSVFFGKPVDLKHWVVVTADAQEPAPIPPVEALLTDGSPVPTAGCRHPAHGIERWSEQNEWTADSGWEPEGSIGAGYCADERTARRHTYPEREIVLVDSTASERTKLRLRQRKEVRYTCFFKEQWDPVYRLEVSEHCTTPPDGQGADAALGLASG